MDRSPELPASKRSGDERIDQGAHLAVLVIFAVLVVLGTWILAFVAPPAFFAAALAFGPVSLIGLTTWVLHVRAKGLTEGDPP